MIRPCIICGQPSETEIPAGRVCHDHAIEFYEGLVAFAIDRNREIVEWVPVSKRKYTKRSPWWFTEHPKLTVVAA